MKNYISFVMICFLSGSLYAQSPKYAFGDFYTSLGFLASSANESGSLSDYQKAIPNSALLANFKSTSFGNVFHFSGSGNFNVSTSIYKWNEKQKAYSDNRALRVGVSFFGKYANYLNYDIYNKTPYDTLNSNNGTVYYIDSVYTEAGSMGSFSQNLSIDLSLIFRTNSSKRWTLYSGVGLQAGFEFNKKVIVNQYKSSSLQFSDSYQYSVRSEYDSDHQSESFNLKSGFVGLFYVPLGIDWQTGNRRPFFKQLHLFAELRPSLIIDNGILDGADINTGLSSQFGVRIKFLNP